MTAGGGVDVLAVLDAFAAQGGQVCCGMYQGGGMDENGNGEPPSCCGQPFDTDDLKKARRQIAELIAADKEYDEARSEVEACNSYEEYAVAVARGVLHRLGAATARRASALGANVRTGRTWAKRPATTEQSQ